MTYGYKVGGRRVSLQVAEDRFAVRFREPSTRSDRLSAAAAKPEIGDIDRRFEVPSEKFTVLDVAPARARAGERLDAAVAAMDSDPTVERCSPVFVVGEALAFAPNRLLVGFVSRKGAKKILAAHACEIRRRSGKEYLVEIDAGLDPFVVTSRLDALPEVAYAEPDFVSFGSHLEQPAPDFGLTSPLAPDQWALRNTKAEEAWALQTGDPRIKIAVLDVGVDTDHVDLAGAIADKTTCLMLSRTTGFRNRTPGIPTGPPAPAWPLRCMTTPQA